MKYDVIVVWNGVDETCREALNCGIDDNLVFKVQRPHRLRHRTSLEKEVFFLNRCGLIQ